jgi:glycosyltransferase involved in cell wall biosynthesis
MRILLIGNFPPDRQESMLRFCGMMSEGLKDLGHEVDTWHPIPAASRLVSNYRYGGFPKYLGYFDKFVAFPRIARRRLAAAAAANRLPDIVHIVDQANGVYGGLFKGLPHLVTCHDLLQVRAARGEFPSHGLNGRARRHQQWILRSLGGVPMVVCCSQKTLGDLLRLTGRPAERARVVHNGLNYPFAPIPRPEARSTLLQLLMKRGLALDRLGGDAGGFVLNVGGGQWYKNRPALLRIYASLRRRLSPAPSMLMVGKPLSPDDARLARELGVAPDILLLSDVSGRELEAAYGAAEALIFPSLEEGFGWPVAEAQACACPVFTTGRPPMTEVGGEGASYFDPALADEAAALIAGAWPRRRQLGHRGLARAAAWDPRLMLEGYMAVYAEMAEAPATLATP